MSGRGVGALDPTGPSPRISTSAEIKLVGLSATMSMADPAMRRLWQRFRPRVREIPDRASRDFISMRIYDPPLETAPRMDSRFVQWAAVEVTGFGHVPAPLRTHTVPSGLYAVYVHHGTADGFAGTARLIFGEWLPSSPYRLAPRPFFEVLGPDYRPDDPDATEEIWIPIRERG